MRYVGVDVSAKTLAVHIYGVKDKKPGEFDNTPAGHKKLVKYMSQGKTPVHVCLEATGTYHFDLALFLYHKAHVEVMVINPKIAKNFAVTLSRTDKTDQADAAVLAEYCSRMQFVPWKKPQDEYIKLRGYSRHLASMTYHLVQLKNELHAVEASEGYGQKQVIKSIKQLLRTYERQLNSIEASAREFIRQHEELERYFNLICTVKGIADKSAIQLLGELLILPKGMTKEQWVKHAGLNPCRYQSGTSINKKPRISKTGNRHLRTALFMPALSATRWDPYVRGFYAHLILDQGLKKMQAVCAVMRKLLHAIHAILESNSPYNNKRFFAKPFIGPINA